MGTGILVGRHPTACLRRVEARLLLRPLVALELIRSLLVLALPVLRVEEHITTRAIRRRARNPGRRGRPGWFRLGRALVTRRRYHFVLILGRNPPVIGVVRVIVR